MSVIQLAKGSYAKIKITRPDEDFMVPAQVFAFIYNDQGQILKTFSKAASDDADELYTPVDAEVDSFYVEFMPDDTKKCDPGNYYCDVQMLVALDEEADPVPVHNPSFLDENIIFELKPSVAKSNQS